MLTSSLYNYFMYPGKEQAYIPPFKDTSGISQELAVSIHACMRGVEKEASLRDLSKIVKREQFTLQGSPHQLVATKRDSTGILLFSYGETIPSPEDETAYHPALFAFMTPQQDQSWNVQGITGRPQTTQQADALLRDLVISGNVRVNPITGKAVFSSPDEPWLVAYTLSLLAGQADILLAEDFATMLLHVTHQEFPLSPYNRFAHLLGRQYPQLDTSISAMPTVPLSTVRRLG